MKILLVILVLATSSVAQVSTQCTTSGSNTDCTSTDIGAQNRQTLEAGQAIGNSMGNVLGVIVMNHSLKKYCKKHPGESYHGTGSYAGRSGVCPPAKGVVAANVTPTPAAPIKTDTSQEVTGSKIDYQHDPAYALTGREGSRAFLDKQPGASLTPATYTDASCLRSEVTAEAELQAMNVKYADLEKRYAIALKDYNRTPP